MENEQQSQNLLHKVDPRSTFRNNFPQPATNIFVARQVDYARRKTGNIDQNLQRNNVARQVEVFCFSYFAALRMRRNGANVLIKATLHEAMFLVTCNATMTNKKPFKLQRGCYKAVYLHILICKN